MKVINSKTELGAVQLHKAERGQWRVVNMQQETLGRIERMDDEKWYIVGMKECAGYANRAHAVRLLQRASMAA